MATSSLSIPLPTHLTQIIGAGIDPLKSPIFDYSLRSRSNLIDAIALILLFHIIQSILHQIPVYFFGLSTYSISTHRLLNTTIRRENWFRFPRLTKPRLLVLLLLFVQLVSQTTLLHFNTLRPRTISITRSGLRRIILDVHPRQKKLASQKKEGGPITDVHSWCTPLVTGTSTSTVRPLNWCLQPVYSLLKTPDEGVDEEHRRAVHLLVGYRNERQILVGLKTAYKEIYAVGDIQMRVDDSPVFVQLNLTRAGFPSSEDLGEWIGGRVGERLGLRFERMALDGDGMVNLPFELSLQQGSVYASSTGTLEKELEEVMDIIRGLLNQGLMIKKKKEYVYTEKDFVTAIDGFFSRVYEGSGYEKFAEIGMKRITGGVLWVSVFVGLVISLGLTAYGKDTDLATDVAIAEALRMKWSSLQTEQHEYLGVLVVQADRGEQDSLYESGMSLR